MHSTISCLLITLNALYSVVSCRPTADSSSFPASVPLCTKGSDPTKDINGTIYSVYCGSDFSGGEGHDLQVTLQSSLEDCLIQCSNFNKQEPRSSEDTCNGVVHTDQSLCYLKNAFENQHAAPGKDSAYFFDAAPAGSNCMQNDRELYRESKYNDEYQILCQTELQNGIVFDSFNGTYLTDCLVRCSEITRGDDAGPCLGATLKDGICSLRGGDYIKSETSPYAVTSAIFTKQDYANQ